MIYKSMVLRRKNTQMCPIIELYTYCFMNKKYVERIKWKKAYLICVGNISM